MLGETLSHYQITAKLGEGGMGVVWKARDQQLNRFVALKMLPAGKTADANRRARFLQEAQAASALNHPNIVTIYDVVRHQGADCIVMEFVAGKTLEHAIPKQGLRLNEALQYAVQIADALARAHASGIVHRDLKPSNIMVDEHGQVKVLDFGLAKLTEAAPVPEDDETRTLQAPTEEGSIAGTAAYMSPEQAEGKKVDARSDIFSFGALLYEMVTGRRAFQRHSTAATLSAILKEEPEPVSNCAPGAPRELEKIIAHCLRKDQSRRYQHMDDLKVALEDLKAESESGAPAAGPALRGTAALPHLSVRIRWIWAVAGVILLGLLAAVGTLSNVRERLAGRIARPAGRRLSTGDRASPNREANEYFERAILLTLSSADLMRAREMLEKALTLDPRFAAARALYGFTHWRLIDWGYSNDTSWLYRAETDLRQALRDDPQVQAHGRLAAVYFTQGRKELLLAEVDQALAANPNDTYALHWLAHYHRLHGNYREALRLWRGILEREPMFWPSRMNIGDTLRMMGDAAGAVREQENILEQSPGNVFALHYLAMAHLTASHLPEARRALESVRQDDRPRFLIRMPWALLLALEGQREAAAKEMDEELLKWGAVELLMTLYVAEFYAVTGDAPKALEWLERSVRSGDERAEWFRQDPLLASIRSDPRFKQVLDSVEYRRQQRSQK